MQTNILTLTLAAFAVSVAADCDGTKDCCWGITSSSDG